MKRYYHSSGIIMMLTVIIISAVGLVVGTYLLFSAVSTGKTSLSVQQSQQAKDAANACAELALGLLQTNINLTTPVTSSFIVDNVAKSSCSYNITGVSPNYTILATGAVQPTGNNVTRKVSIILNQVGPVLNIASWQEQ